MGGIKTLFLAAAVVIVTWLFSSMEMTHVLYSKVGPKRPLAKVGPKRPLATEGTPPQRCDYTFDDRINNTFYDDKCWRKYSVDDWRHREGGASRALFDHGAVYLKNILEYEEAKVLREYLVGELSPKTLDGEDYYVKKLRNSKGRYDLQLDPRSQEPVLDALNKVVERLRTTLETILDSEASLQELSVYTTCNAGLQKAHRDACALCCPIMDAFEDQGRLQEVSRITADEKVAILKPTHYENQKCAYLYSMFIALQPTTKAIGVTFTYPGSHLVFPWSADSAPGDVNKYVKSELQRCEPSLNTGDGFLYNSVTVHAANANPTASARMMLGLSFASKRLGKRGHPFGSLGSIPEAFKVGHQILNEERIEDSECSVRSCMCGGDRPCNYESGRVAINHFPMVASQLAEQLEHGENDVKAAESAL